MEMSIDEAERYLTEGVVLLIYFLILYGIAFFSNLRYRDDDDILWISKSQWKAICLMFLPAVIAMLIR